MIQAILLPLARTTTFLEFITWPSEIWQGKKKPLMFQHSVSGFYILLFFKICQIGVCQQIKHYFPNSDESCHLQGQQPFQSSSRGQARYGKVKKIFRGHCVLKRVFTQTFPENRNFWSQVHRAEICLKFGWFFGKFEDAKISF